MIFKGFMVLIGVVLGYFSPAPAPVPSAVIAPVAIVATSTPHKASVSSAIAVAQPSVPQPIAATTTPDVTHETVLPYPIYTLPAPTQNMPTPDPKPVIYSDTMFVEDTATGTYQTKPPAIYSDTMFFDESHATGGYVSNFK